MFKYLMGAKAVKELLRPESIDFNGTNDYLSRSSDLVGNTDSKTFTFSCWVYIAKIGQNRILRGFTSNGSSYGDIIIYYNNNNKISFQFYRAGTTTSIFDFFTPEIPINTFLNIIVSVDISTSSNRYVYINDKECQVTWGAYLNENINFTQNNYGIGNGNYDNSEYIKGRLSHLFLDYTYRNLSIEANRRLFITEEGKPADDQAALNPILYLPMTDHTTCHVNEGTGGDFVQNGVIGQSERGPNQWNCVASKFDGVDDDITHSLSISTESKVITVSGSVNNKGNTANYVFNLSQRFSVELSSSNLSIYGFNSIDNYIFDVKYSNVAIGKEIHFTLSIDLNDINKRHLIVEGREVTPTWTWNNENISFSGSSNHKVCIGSSWVDNIDPTFDGSIGELYFDTNYIDLLVNNPFWNSKTNKPKPVRQILEETGIIPLIAMPISADNPELNLGNSGDFTLNGGGLVGARGGSEFWSRSVVVDESNYLTGNIYCESLVKWKSTDSGITWNPSYTNSETVTNIGNGVDNGIVSYYWGTSENINWSLEENKLRVTDSLGFPIDINNVLTNNPNTVIALFFDDPDNLGKNNGTGGDFTVNGTIIQGADVNV